MKEKWKGIIFCLILASGAHWLGGKLPLIGGPVIGMFFGIAAGSLIKERTALSQGIAFTSKKVLQYAVILLGFGLNLKTVWMVGASSLPIIVSTISIALVSAFFLSKVLKIEPKIATLVGVGSSICGGSAVAATAPVIEADEGQIAQAISVIFLFNIIAALIFPALGEWMGLSNEGFALFAGTAINDTSSVTAASSIWDTLHHTGAEVLERATVVKLTRTLAIIPITLVLALIQAKKAHQQEKQVSIRKIFPTFILYFVLCSLLTTFAQMLMAKGVLSAEAGDGIQSFFHTMKKTSKFFIVMAMSAIGFNTDPVRLIKSGAKPLILGGGCWLSIIAMSLSMQSILNRW